VGRALSPKNQNLQELGYRELGERNARQNVKFENGGSYSLRPKSKPKNHDSNNDAKLGKRNYARQNFFVVINRRRWYKWSQISAQNPKDQNLQACKNDTRLNHPQSHMTLKWLM
jgi:hypothetical protein